MYPLRRRGDLFNILACREFVFDPSRPDKTETVDTTSTEKQRTWWTIGRKDCEFDFLSFGNFRKFPNDQSNCKPSNIILQASAQKYLFYYLFLVKKWNLLFVSILLYMYIS